MNLTKQQRKAIWICLALVAASYVIRSVMNFAQQQEYMRQQFIRAAQQQAKAQADANRILNESLTPMLIQYEGLQRWNGTLPLMTGGGAIPMVQLPFNAAKPGP